MALRGRFDQWPDRGVVSHQVGDASNASHEHNRAIILLMETKPLAEIRQDLSKFVDEAMKTHARYDVTRNGTRAAVLMSADDYDSLVETLDVLADADLVRDIHDGLRDAEAGNVSSHDEVVAELAAARKTPSR